MPSKQRRRLKRRSFAKEKVKRKKESSELIETIDGNPIFTVDDFEDDRITKLLRQKQENSQFDDEEQAIFVTDLLSSDEAENSSEDDDDDHDEMLQNIFSSQSLSGKEAVIAGSQHIANPNQLIIDEADNENERISMNQMLESINVPISKSAAKQLEHFDDSQQVQRLKLTVESKINSLNIERKSRGLQMDKSRKEMSEWTQSVRLKREELADRKKMIPPRNNMQSFMSSMEWNGEFGKELECVLDDYSKEHDIDLDVALNKYKPNKFEIIKQRKKMVSMRREIANQIKEFKRIKKIKSKSFRKRMRARKQKISPSLSELQEIDPKLYQREVKKLLRQRAEERMTLKHKNTNKWAMNIIRRGKNAKIDPNSRKALMEQLERGKELKRRIEGLDSDESMDEKSENDADMVEVNGTKNVFETEIQSEKKCKNALQKDIKDKGIWNMKFMKEAENKRKNDIRSLTYGASQSHNFEELDGLERSVDKIEKSAHSVHAMIDSTDDPIAAKKYKNWLKKREKIKATQVNKAQTILGKRKFGFSDLTDDVNATGMGKKRQKHKILDVGNAAKMISGTQMIEESAFGQGTKSMMNVAVMNEEKELVTKDVLKNKIMNEGVFEMIEFPKHDQSKQSISEINENASKDVNERELKTMNRINKRLQIKHQRVYFDDDESKSKSSNEQNEEKNDSDDDNEWKVILNGNESVHNIHFGTMNVKKPKKNHKKTKNKKNDETDENLQSFLNESSDENDVENEQKNEKKEVVIKSILKRTKYQSVANNDKHIQWTKNAYSDGNPHTKFHSPKQPKQKTQKSQKRIVQNVGNANPWLNGLQKNKSSKSTTQQNEQNGQSETTQFDRNKLLIPSKMVKQPDFTLLDSNDANLIEMDYENSQNTKDKFAQFSAHNTAKSEFAQLKESVIEKAMPNAPEEALRGWDHWTGYGIVDDAALRDDEYLEAKALHEKKKKKLMEMRSDGNIKNVILSDEISKKSSKYVLKWQPDWVNIGMYNAKMRETMGREWNLSTEFYEVIKPKHDIPSGFNLRPTQKMDANDEANQYKTSFGKNKKQKYKKQSAEKLYSVYNNNHSVNIPSKRQKNDQRPERDRS